MMDFDIRNVFPRFILHDRTGYAMARALEAGMKIFMETVQTGLDCVQDVSKMPEWRLDEIAWETGCLYDYEEDIDVKREWIMRARENAAIEGTPEALKRFLKAKFNEITIEEWWQYGGDPYHFKINAADEWSQEKNDWALKAVELAKNVRSIMDSFVFHGGSVDQELIVGISIVGESTESYTTIRS